MPRSREDQKLARAERYAHYRSLCIEFGAAFQQPWHIHYQQLRAPVLERERRLTKEEHFAFWRERLTDKEIYDCASAIDFLSSEGRQVA